MFQWQHFLFLASPKVKWLCFQILQVLGLQTRILNFFSITKTIFSHIRSEQFWKQNTIFILYFTYRTINCCKNHFKKLYKSSSRLFNANKWIFWGKITKPNSCQSNKWEIHGLWQYQLWSFKFGDTKLVRLLPSIF